MQDFRSDILSSFDFNLYSFHLKITINYEGRIDMQRGYRIGTF